MVLHIFALVRLRAHISKRFRDPAATAAAEEHMKACALSLSRSRSLHTYSPIRANHKHSPYCSVFSVFSIHTFGPVWIRVPSSRYSDTLGNRKLSAYICSLQINSIRVYAFRYNVVEKGAMKFNSPFIVWFRLNFGTNISRKTEWIEKRPPKTMNIRWERRRKQSRMDRKIC